MRILALTHMNPPTLSLPLEGGGLGGGDFFCLPLCGAVFSVVIF